VEVSEHRIDVFVSPCACEQRRYSSVREFSQEPVEVNQELEKCDHERSSLGEDGTHLERSTVGCSGQKRMALERGPVHPSGCEMNYGQGRRPSRKFFNVCIIEKSTSVNTDVLIFKITNKNVKARFASFLPLCTCTVIYISDHLSKSVSFFFQV